MATNFSVIISLKMALGDILYVNAFQSKFNQCLFFGFERPSSININSADIIILHWRKPQVLRNCQRN